MCPGFFRLPCSQTVITVDELMETSDVLNQVSAASVVQQNAAALFYCEAPELFCSPDFISSGGGEEDFISSGGGEEDWIIVFGVN